MNTTFTLIGSYNWFFCVKAWVTGGLQDQVQPNDKEIKNHKTVADNSVILNVVDTLLTSVVLTKMSKHRIDITYESLVKSAKLQKLKNPLCLRSRFLILSDCFRKLIKTFS